MARFYFELNASDIEDSDQEGIEFASVSDAALDAAMSLARMMAEAIARPVPNVMFIVVRDEQRKAVARVALSLDIQIPTGNRGER